MAGYIAIVSKLSFDAMFVLNLSIFSSVLGVIKLFLFPEVTRSILLCLCHKVLSRIE